jgi:hypothetical protein
MEGEQYFPEESQLEHYDTEPQADYVDEQPRYVAH